MYAYVHTQSRTHPAIHTHACWHKHTRKQAWTHTSTDCALTVPITVSLWWFTALVEWHIKQRRNETHPTIPVFPRLSPLRQFRYELHGFQRMIRHMMIFRQGKKLKKFKTFHSNSEAVMVLQCKKSHLLVNDLNLWPTASIANAWEPT